MTEWTEVATLTDPDNVVCVITERTDGDRRYHSFAFFKEFPDHDGVIKRSAFFARRHSSGIRRLLGQLEEWLDRRVEQTIAERRAAR